MYTRDDQQRERDSERETMTMKTMKKTKRQRRQQIYINIHIKYNNITKKTASASELSFFSVFVSFHFVYFFCCSLCRSTTFI